MGFDEIARQIYSHHQVESVYLMSGGFDLTVIISGRTMREVARFVDVYKRQSKLLEQHKVLHVACTQLDDINISEQVEMFFTHDLGDDGQTGLTLGFEQQLETLSLIHI